MTDEQDVQDALIAQLERAAKLDPEHCGRGSFPSGWYVGPSGARAYVGDGKVLGWGSRGLIQAGVQAACDARGWQWAVGSKRAVVRPPNRLSSRWVKGPPALALFTAFNNALEAEQEQTRLKEGKEQLVTPAEPAPPTIDALLAEIEARGWSANIGTKRWHNGKSLAHIWRGNMADTIMIGEADTPLEALQAAYEKAKEVEGN